MSVLGACVLCKWLLVSCYVFSFAPVFFPATPHDAIENLRIRLRQAGQLLNPQAKALPQDVGEAVTLGDAQFLWGGAVKFLLADVRNCPSQF